MAEALTIQTPAGSARQLLLLFHGVGATPRDMAPLGHVLARAFPQAMVVSVPGPQASDLGGGCQWFSVQGVTEENRPERVAQAMPGFVDTVRHWQRSSGVPPEATALIGFSQGAIMALESTQLGELLAGRVVALSGRFARVPEHAPEATTLHFIHGKADPVIPYSHTVHAAERLVRLGADVTADVIPFLGHHVDAEVERLLIERLTGHLPQRIWREALRSAPET